MFSLRRISAMSPTTAMPSTGTPRTRWASARISQPCIQSGWIPRTAMGKEGKENADLQAVPLLPASADRLLADELWQSDSED